MILLCIVTTICVDANPIIRSEALELARRFMPGKEFSAGEALARSETAREEEAFYVFNATDGGFVIISGDDSTVPVIGYSDRGAIHQENMPENLRSWLEGYNLQLKAISTREAIPVTSRHQLAAKVPIDPLIETQWNQGYPYNLMTPTYKNSNGQDTHYVTGCVQTAVAQMMYYYQWPKTCPAIPAYTTYTHHIYMEELPATDFDWLAMKPQYSYNDTGASADAVAKLMRYVGQANQVDYDLSGSSAAVYQNAMIETFGYSRNMHSVSRRAFTTEEWEDMLYQELAANRPVLYSGQSESGGHEFICDGYDGNGLFHINWGWGGGSDGFFVISLANPAEKGIGGGEGTGGYAFSQSAILGFQPASDNEPEIPIFECTTSYMENATYSRSSADADFENVSTQDCYFYARYNYVPTTTYPIEAGWGLWKDGEMLQILATKDVTVDYRDMSPGWFYYLDGPTKVNFGAGLADGNYKLVLVWRPQGSMEWTIMSSINAIYAEISGNSLSVRGYNSEEISYTIDDVSYSGDMAQGSSNRVDVTLTNTCDAMQIPVFYWMRENGTWNLKGRGIGSVEPGKTGHVNIAFTQDAPSTYDVRISSDVRGEQVVWTSTVTIYALKQVVVDDVVYLLNAGSKEGKITGIDPNAGNPQTIHLQSEVSYGGDNYRVTHIESDAFYNQYSVKEIVIPEGIETIGNWAFGYCSQMKKLSLPSTLKSIGIKAFYGAQSLQSVIVAMTEPIAITPDVFTCYTWVGNDIIERFTEATLYVPQGRKAAYQYAEVWGQFATIYDGELREVVQNGITYNYVTTEDFADIVAADGEMLNEKDVVIPATISADGKTYKVRKIKDRVFYQINMATLTIEPGLEEIGSYCFWNSYRISKLVIPESVKSIGAYAFQYCFGLSELNLPTTLQQIGESAFGNCTRLKSVFSRMQTPCAITSNVFQIKSDDNVSFSSATLYIPIGTRATYQQAEVWKDFPTILEGEQKEATIDGITYRYVTGEDFSDIVAADAEILNDKDLVIPATITVDGKTYRVRKIEDRIFYQVRMNSLTIEPGLEEIGSYNFWNRNNLKKVVIPEGVKTIGACAFRYCYGLTEVGLPSTLVSIGELAFGDTPLKSIVSAMLIPCAINPNVFENVNFDNATLLVPEGTKSRYQSAEGWKLFTKIKEKASAGDANGDGTLDIADVVDAINYILGKTSNSSLSATCDLNHDGEVDVFDVTMMINLILSTDSRSVTADMARSEYSAWEHLHLTDKGKTVSIHMEHAERFTAFQFTVEVPEGAELAEIIPVEPMKRHMVKYARTADGCYTIVALSMGNETLSAVNNMLMECRLTGNPHGNVSISNVLFVTPDGQGTRFSDATIAVSTSIESTMAVSKEEVIHDLSGRRGKQLSKGIQIVNGKKVIIK